MAWDNKKCRMPRPPPRHFFPRGRGGRPPFRPRGGFINRCGFFGPRPPFRGMPPWRCPRPPPRWQRPPAPKIRTVSNSSDGTVPPGTVPPGTESSPESVPPNSRPLLPTPNGGPEQVNQSGTNSSEKVDSQTAEAALQSPDFSAYSSEIPACLTALFPENPLAAMRFNGPLPSNPPGGKVPPAPTPVPAFEQPIVPPGTTDYSYDFTASSGTEDAAYTYLAAFASQFGTKDSDATYDASSKPYKRPTRKPICTYSYTITPDQTSVLDDAKPPGATTPEKTQILCYVEMFELNNYYCNTYYFGEAAEQAQRYRMAMTKYEETDAVGANETPLSIAKPPSPPGVQPSTEGDHSPSTTDTKEVTPTTEKEMEDGNNNVADKLLSTVSTTTPEPAVSDATTNAAVKETSDTATLTGTSPEPTVAETTVSQTSTTSSVSGTSADTVSVTTMAKPLTISAGDRAIATVKPSIAKAINRLPPTTTTINVDNDGHYAINELLEFEPPQSAGTMFKLLVWEMYQRYFAMRPMVETQIFLFARLYKLMTHEVSADTMFTCAMKCKTNLKMTFKEYISHVETMEHLENTVRFISRKQPFGWKALKRTLGRRSWFCEICTDLETKTVYKTKDIKRHLYTSREHKRRRTLIFDYLKEVKLELNMERTLYPIPQNIQTIQCEFQRLTRSRIEFWMRSRNPKDKFKCTLHKCKDTTFSTVEEYLDHCQSYYHMLTMYSYFHSLGANNIFNEYIKLSRYSSMDKQYFCGICAWRRPSDNPSVDPLLNHSNTREHERNLELLTECFKRDEQRCLYRCQDNCSIDHAPSQFAKRKAVARPNMSSFSSYSHRLQLEWRSSTTSNTRKGPTSTTDSAVVSDSEPSSSKTKFAEAFPFEKKSLNYRRSSLAKALAIAKKRSEEIFTDKKTSNVGNSGELAPLEKQDKPVSSPPAVKVKPQMRVSGQQVVADSKSQTDMSATITNTESKPLSHLSSKALKDILQGARAAQKIGKKEMETLPTFNNKESTGYLPNSVGALKAQFIQKPQLYDSDEDSKPLSLMCKIPLSAVPVTDYLKESKHQKKKSKKAKKAKKQAKAKLPMAYSDPTSNGSRSPSPRRSRKKVQDSDLSDDDQYSKGSEYTAGSKRSHKRSQSPDQKKKRQKNLYSSSSDKAYGSSRSQSKESYQRQRRTSRSYASSDDSDSRKSRFRAKRVNTYNYHRRPLNQSCTKSPRSTFRKSYSYQGNKGYRNRTTRHNTSSSSLDSAKLPAKSKYSSTRHRKRSRSSSFSDSSYNHSPSPHRRHFSSSRSRSHSPAARRYSRRSRSRSNSDSTDFKSNRVSRHLSPPPLPQHNSNVYCTDQHGNHPRLIMRSLSPMSADVVSKTVENAWNVYYNRYYSKKKSFSSDGVLDSQYVFLKSYSGFFTTPPNFENCYDTLSKPEDLKTALRQRLDRLSPGPTRNSSEHHMKQPAKKVQSSDLDASTVVKAKDTASSMESLIRTGAVPGLAILNDTSAATTVGNTDDIQSAIQSLRQSFSEADLRKGNNEPNRHLRSINESPTDSKFSFLQSPSSDTNDKAAIPFLNDGTLAQRKPSPKPEYHTKWEKRSQSGEVETPWHYSERWSPTDQYKDQTRTKTSGKRKAGGRRPSRFSSPIRTTTAPVVVPPSASSSFEQPSSIKPLVSYNEDDSSDVVEGSDAEKGEEIVKSLEKPAQCTDHVHTVGGVVMSTFIGEVVRGIIRLSTLQADEELSAEQRDAEIDKERSEMHSRMISAAGHYMIHMARCRLSQPDRLGKDFSEADVEAVELMQSMDDRVVELIASTPFLDD